MRWRSVWLAASSVLVPVLAGCGSSAPTRTTKPPPRIPGNVARQLAADADAVASASGCAARAPAQKLLNDVITSEAQIPQRYLEQLTSSANDLVSRVPACPPQHDHGKHKGHKKKHDKHDEGD